MSGAKDFFQNVGSVLTFGIIPPAKPHIDELSEEEAGKVQDDAMLIYETSLKEFGPDKITNDVSSILAASNVNFESLGQPPVLPTDTSPPNTYTPPNTYIPNNPMRPY